MRLNLTQHGKPYQFRTQQGLTDCELFLDSVDGGAWPFLVGGVVCLVDSVNERDLCLSIGCASCKSIPGSSELREAIDASDCALGAGCPSKHPQARANSRSVMLLNVLDCTRITLTGTVSCSTSFELVLF